MKIRLSRYGDTGWEFSVTCVTLAHETVTERYRTNPTGDGLWRYRASPTSWYPDGSPVMEYHQEAGTCQFWLPKERKPAYDKIRHQWSKES